MSDVGRRDLAFFGAAAAILAAFCRRALWSSSACLMNFGDLYAYHYPLRHAAASALQAGRLPFWNAYIFSGLPLAANPQAVLFYPPAILGYVFPLSAALTWDMYLHWLCAWLGWTLVGRREGLRSGEAFLIGAIFALCPFVVYRITEGIPTLLAALAWTPWCWLAWLGARRWWLAAAFALAFLSGHPQFLVFNAAAMALWALLRGEVSALGRLVREGAAAAALAAMQWLPTREFLAHSVRSHWPAAFSLGYSIDWPALATWISPGAWGDPLRRTYLGAPSVFFEGSGLFLGVVGLGLAAWGLRRRPRVRRLSLIAAGLFIAAGAHNPAYRWLLAHSPLSWLRTPSRALFFCLLGLLSAAGAGARSAGGPFRRRGLRAAVLILGLLDLVVWDARFAKPDDAGRYLAFNRPLAVLAGGAPLRVMTDPALASADKAMLYRARNVNGYDAFYLDGYAQFAARSEGRPAADASRTYLIDPNTPQMRELGVAYFISASGALVSARRSLPLIYAARESRPAQLPSLDLSLPRPEIWRARGVLPRGAARLVLSQPVYPGWRAWLDGRRAPISAWDGLLQSVAVPAAAAGRAFELDARYVPTGWTWLALAAALSWGLWLRIVTKEALA